MPFSRRPRSAEQTLFSRGHAATWLSLVWVTFDATFNLGSVSDRETSSWTRGQPPCRSSMVSCHLSVFVRRVRWIVRLSRPCGELFYLVVSSRDGERSFRFWVVFSFSVVYCMRVAVVYVCWHMFNQEATVRLVVLTIPAVRPNCPSW